MNKGELVEEIHQNSDLTKGECKEALDQFMDLLVKTVAEGEVVRLVNFGTFKPNPRKDTVKRHPMTGEKIEVPATVVPKFSSGKGFKQALQENLEAKRDGYGELEVERK